MRVWKVILFGMLCGGLIFVFSIWNDMLKYVFSLGALYIGYQFFTRNDSRGMRIGFVCTSIVFYFIYTFFYAVYQFTQLPLPEA
ncbi:hypothetical protein SAMN02799630_04297 [Paenibacillus sp. UNCCL117]|uniref:hypothetical protein n=1 Tax=unclassified Paenibacillus TaxID=185978 RepID=UPI000884733B|nr:MULTISPECIES: hypothetical protein [unclassified Paenibacillus]SDD98248.1 hypothetical protein SAMN04488602_11697 [Paenibacillus sp. cl123]SFW56002.1 hypothetical protein SAMN02799630_04297 [Paenibacillus sp. UNCCL117]